MYIKRAQNVQHGEIGNKQVPHKCNMQYENVQVEMKKAQKQC